MRYQITFSFAVFSECTLKTVPILGILSDALTGKVSNDHYLVIFQENEKKRYDDSIVSYYLFICLVFTLKFIVIITIHRSQLKLLFVRNSLAFCYNADTQTGTLGSRRSNRNLFYPV